MSFFRDIFYEMKWMSEEIIILFKHPSRKASWQDLKHHWSKLWNYIIFNPFYCLKRGIKNLISWFPLIWKNDCWDYFYLEEIMDKQLKIMEDFWKEKADKERSGFNYVMEKGFYCQDRRIWKRIKWTRKYLSMYQDEYYTMKAFDEHNKAFPNKGKMFEHDEEDITRDEYGVPILYTCKPMAEDEMNDFTTRIKIAREKDEKVFKLWLKNLSYIRNWWN